MSSVSSSGTVVLSNLRKEATVSDWPSGGKRVMATFEVESDKRGRERVSRVTTGRQKKTTYYKKIRIADGDNGRIYLLALTQYNQICVIEGTLTGHEYVYESLPAEAERYRLLKNLLENCE